LTSKIASLTQTPLEGEKKGKGKKEKDGKGIRHWVLKHVGPSYTSIDYRHIHPIEFSKSLKMP
jgi:hypothetical protein